jgi:hypothetical protein
VLFLLGIIGLSCLCFDQCFFKIKKQTTNNNEIDKRYSFVDATVRCRNCAIVITAVIVVERIAVVVRSRCSDEQCNAARFADVLHDT